MRPRSASGPVSGGQMSSPRNIVGGYHRFQPPTHQFGCVLCRKELRASTMAVTAHFGMHIRAGAITREDLHELMSTLFPERTARIREAVAREGRDG
jgi:hypothetical protein